MNKLMGLLVFGMFIFAVGIVSAEFVVIGTVYENSFGGNLSDGALVRVSCNGADVFSTTGASGTYAIVINDSDCNESHSWSTFVSKSGFNSFSGGSKPLVYASMLNIAGLHSSVVDFVLSPKSSSGGSSSGGGGSSGRSQVNACVVEFWDCSESWGECVGDSQNRMCYSNCDTSRVEERGCTNDILLSQELSEPEVADGGGFFSAITGAVTGVTSTTGGLIVSVFIVLAVVGLGAVGIRRRFRK